MTSPKRFACALGVAQLLVCVGAIASPTDLFGAGLRSQSMGHTGAAYGLHDHQSYTNPALLGGRAHQHVSLAYQSALFQTSYQAGEHRLQSAHASALGVTLPLPFGGALERRLALGLSAYSPRKLVSKAQLWFPERPQFPLLVPRAQSLSLTTALGVKLHETVSVGAGVRWLSSLAGSVVVSESSDGEVDAVVRDELLTSTSPLLGLTLRPFDELRLGLVWRRAQVSDLKLEVRLADLGALTLPPLDLAGTAHYDPEQLEVEAAFVRGAWQLAVATRYRVWARFPGFLRATVSCPAGELACGSAPPPAPGFSNTWSPRAGAAYGFSLSRHAVAELRFGTAYEPTPAPEQTESSNYWDSSRWVGTVGYGVSVELGETPVDFELALQRHWLVERQHRKSEAFRSHAPELSQVTTRGHVQLVAIGVGAQF